MYLYTYDLFLYVGIPSDINWKCYPVCTHLTIGTYMKLDVCMFTTISNDLTFHTLFRNHISICMCVKRLYYKRIVNIFSARETSQYILA